MGLWNLKIRISLKAVDLWSDSIHGKFPVLWFYNDLIPGSSFLKGDSSLIYWSRKDGIE